MKMMQFATQRACAFSFDNFAMDNKANLINFFRVIVKNESLIDHRNVARKCSKLDSETTYLRLAVPLEF